MKTRLSVVLAAAVGVGYLSGCATFFGRAGSKMSTSSTLPAADGIVRFARTKNGNTAIEVTVKHLADPEKLNPPEHIYVVWVRSDQTTEPENLGALAVDENLDGRLETVTPLHSFALFITAEASGQVKVPTGVKLLWTDYSK